VSDALRYPVVPEDRLHPDPRLVKLQEAVAPSRVEIWDGSRPWLFTRYDDVRQVLNDPRVSADSTHPHYPSTSLAIKVTRDEFPTFLQLDAPEHGRLRRMVAADFTAAKAEQLRPRLQAIVDDAIDRLRGFTPPVDFVEHFAQVVAWQMTAEMLGVPQRDYEFFRTCAGVLSSGVSSVDEVASATKQMYRFLDQLILEKERHPQDDVLGRLAGHVRDGEITRVQAVGTARLLLTGGHTSTTSMIALGMLVLFAYPAEMGRVCADRSLLANAVEEMMRFLTVAHIGRRRVVREDIEIAGVTVSAEEGIIADHRMANRDPRMFVEPDQFDVGRQTAGHLGFGAGPHQCLGQHLARVRLQVVFDRILTRIPSLRISGTIDDAVWKDNRVITMGLDELIVTW
jgi:cytochrome P450